MGENKQAQGAIVVSIIIVNYRTPELVLQCVASIRKYSTTWPYEIIVVDNHSQDQSIEILSACSDIQLICNRTNAGFAGANNRGSEIARGKYVYLLNSDTYLVDDTVSMLVDYMENHAHADVGVCGTDLIDPAGKKQASYGHFPSVKELIFQFGPDRLFRNYYNTRLSQGVCCHFNKPKAVDFVSGASMFIRAEVYQQLNGLDEDYFLYFEETDFAFRAQQKHWKVMLLPAAQVVHLEGGSQTGQSKENFPKLERFTIGKLLFFKKHRSTPIIFCVRILLILRLFLAGLRRWDTNYFNLVRRIAKV